MNGGNILQIALDDFELNNPAGGFTLPTEAIEGLFGAPELRVETGDNFGRDGGWINPSKYKARIVQLEGQIFDRDPVELEAKRIALTQHLSQRNHDFTMKVVTYAGAQRFLTVRVLRNPMPALATKNKQTYDLSLYAADPLYYENVEGDLMAIVEKILPGGFDIPFNIPLDIGGGTPPTVITNNGSETMLPVIKIRTPATNPQIINRTTGAIMKVNVSVNTGDELVIDMKRSRITLNGDSVFNMKPDFAIFWGLVVGDNQVEIITDVPSETTEAEVYYSSAFISI